MTITYTPGQLAGWDTFAKFYLAPLENVMLLKGYSGTGKSTLVRMLIERLPKLDEMRKLVDPAWRGMDVLLTATTNQAAMSLSQAIGGQYDTSTIHVAARLKLVTEDYYTKKKKLIAYGDKIRNALIFIDEASYVDQTLLGLIFNQCVDCKIVFVGDPAQLTPVGSDFMPAFKMNKNEIELTDLVRFDAGPISTMVSQLRETVLTDKWYKFQQTKDIVEHVDRDTFNSMVLAAASGNDFGVSKVLAFHNERVVGYNNWLSEQILGSKELQVGQRVMANGAYTNTQSRIFNNEEVLIEDIQPSKVFGYDGHTVQLANKLGTYFLPGQRGMKADAHRVAANGDDIAMMREIDEEWVDLRPSFACTVNKSQGSTYDTVFVDIDDIGKGARTRNQLARYLYVGNSRCRTRCVMTGDIV